MKRAREVLTEVCLRLRRRWVSEGQTANATGSQNLSPARSVSEKAEETRRDRQVTARTRPLWFLRDVIAVGFKVQEYRFHDVRALISRNPLIVYVRAAITLGIFNKSRMNGILDQYFYRVV